MMDVRIDQIKVTRRIRKTFTNIESLASSIEKVGLINPITLDSNYHLICGERRLQAFQLLGKDKIPARIASNLTDAITAMQAELDENSEREPLLPSEIHEAALMLEEIKREEAKVRQLAAQNNTAGRELRSSAPGSELPEEKGNTRDIVGKALGVHGATINRIHKVFTDGTPELQEAVDSKKIGIRAAAEVAKLPKEKQVEIVAKGPEEVRKAAKEKTEKKIEINPSASRIYEGPTFSALTVAVQVDLMLEKIAWKDPNAITALERIAESVQRRREMIEKRITENA